MKKYFLIFILFYFCSSIYAADSESFKLKPEGSLYTRKEEQVFAKNCKAIRMWPEISGLASKEIEKKLNDKFRKIISVGRKLKAVDCPGEKVEGIADENYLYKNTYFIGAQKGDYLGIEFTIFFPGGSGRVVNDCRIFNLKDASEVRLDKYLAKDSLKFAHKIFKERFKDREIDIKYEPEGFKSKSQYSPFCLQKDGIYLLVNAFENIRDDRLKLLPSDRKHIFKDSILVDQLFN
jgi:hypothetical protein